MTKTTMKSNTCDDETLPARDALSPELKSASSFTAQLLALDIGDIAIKAIKQPERGIMQDDATSEATKARQRLRNTVWASIKAAQVREKGRYAARQFEVEVMHVCRTNGAVLVQAIVERVA